MKWLSLLLCFSLSFNVLANQGYSQELEEAIDSYAYSITVEWNQQDAAFKQAKTNELLQSLLAIKEKSGLNFEEVLNVLKTKVHNPEQLEMLKLKAASLDASKGPEYLVNVLAEKEGFYAKGANWNGAAVALYGGMAIIIIGLASYSFWFDANYECMEWVSDSTHNRCVNYEKKN